VRTLSKEGEIVDAEAEKRIRRIVYCAEQLMAKRMKMWATRYGRACKDARSVEELDEALMRVHKKFPDLGLDKVIEAEGGLK
jgi:hypothetical protein